MTTETDPTAAATGTAEPNEVAEQLMHCVTRLKRLVDARLGKHGLTMSRIKVLGLLGHNGPATRATSPPSSISPPAPSPSSSTVSSATVWCCAPPTRPTAGPVTSTSPLLVATFSRSRKRRATRSSPRSSAHSTRSSRAARRCTSSRQRAGCSRSSGPDSLPHIGTSVQALTDRPLHQQCCRPQRRGDHHPTPTSTSR